MWFYCVVIQNKTFIRTNIFFLNAITNCISFLTAAYRITLNLTNTGNGKVTCARDGHVTGSES